MIVVAVIVADTVVAVVCYLPHVSYLFQYFDQDRGADLLAKLTVGDIDADLVAKYTVLAGAHCLLRYIENCQGFSFASHSLR